MSNDDEPFSSKELPADWKNDCRVKASRLRATVEALEREKEEHSTTRRLVTNGIGLRLELSDKVKLLQSQLEQEKAKNAVHGGEWCAENRAEGRGPCGACAWCYKQVRDVAERALDSLRTDRPLQDRVDIAVRMLASWLEP